jgi:protein tyrosine phosphatase (PTP) superfamily phosphohydrolase (DUF442 family)
MKADGRSVTRWAGSLLVLVPLLGGCRQGSPPPASAVSTARPDTLPTEMPGLHNVHRVIEKLVSGSGPEGEAGFESLAKLGVKTVISVDGAKPEVTLAAKRGMRYVHLPVGYDGIPRRRVLELAKAVRDLPGLVYIHCHHGKHRGPAAALAVRLCLDNKCGVEDAVKEMKRVGTDPRYVGLYDAARKLVRPTKKELDDLAAVFPDAAAVSPMARLMVEIDLRSDHLKQIRSSGWKTPPNHPDLDPPHEALLLAEQYREAARLPPLAKLHKELVSLLTEAEAEAAELEQVLRTAKGKGRVDAATAEAAYKKVMASCSRCHTKYRDAPQPK